MLKAGIVTALTGLALLPAAAGATTYNVNTTADGFLGDGKCGLREAVEAANDNQKQSGCPKGEGKRDTILLKAKDYNLTVPSTNENVNVNGDLDLDGGGPITIRGAGRDATEINAPSDDRALDLLNQLAVLKVERVTVDQGDVQSYAGADGLGGTIRSFGGNLTLVKSLVSSGEADSGGLVFSQGKLVSDRTNWNFGAVTADGGGLYLTGPSTIKKAIINTHRAESAANDVRGGAIFSDSSAGVTVTDSALRGNASNTTGGAFDAYGGTIYVDDGVLNLNRSELSNNGATAATNGEDESGGGIYVDGGSTVSLLNTTLYHNITGGPDGAGGNLYNAGAVTARFTSFVDGVAPAFAGQVYTAGTTSIGQSIVEGDANDDPCAGATVTTLGYNVAEFDDPACGYGADDAEDAFLNLGSLAANGGPTQTVAFGVSSAGPDFVPKGLCKTITTRDQRGFVRPNTKKENGKRKPQPCDAGAFEQGAKAP